jgi:RNA polymerase sigma-70 factor (ECF subfamily)
VHGVSERRQAGAPHKAIGASDEALMLRYQRGDRSAFAELVRRYEVRVYNFVLRQLGSALVADELAQRVFLGVVLESSRFNYETPFSTRLFTIACRLCQRERKRVPQPEPRDRADSAPESQVEPLARGSLEETLERAVDSLPSDEKDVYLLREVADVPFRDIALITRQTSSTVRVQMQHALSRLRGVVQDSEQYRRALRSRA